MSARAEQIAHDLRSLLPEWMDVVVTDDEILDTITVALKVQVGSSIKLQEVDDPHRHAVRVLPELVDALRSSLDKISRRARRWVDAVEPGE